MPRCVLFWRSAPRTGGSSIFAALVVPSGQEVPYERPSLARGAPLERPLASQETFWSGLELLWEGRSWPGGVLARLRAPQRGHIRQGCSVERPSSSRLRSFELPKMWKMFGLVRSTGVRECIYIYIYTRFAYDAIRRHPDCIELCC